LQRLQATEVKKMIGLQWFVALPVIGTLVLGQSSTVWAANEAQAGVQATVTAAASEKELTERAFTQCMADWDTSTHMTKGEWNQVCRRVVGDRVRFKMQYQPNQPAMKQN
jgi:hypothetical protein